MTDPEVALRATQGTRTDGVPSVLDPAFAAELASEKLWNARLACLLAAALYALFGIIDLWMIPSALNTVWSIRSVVVTGTLMVLALTWHRRFLSDYTLFALVLVVLWAGGIEAMLFLAAPSDPARDFYYAGLILVVIGFHHWIYLPVVPMVWVSAAIVAIYASIAVVVHDVIGSGGLPTLVSNLFFLVSAVIICVASQVRRYRYLAENFRFRLALVRDVEAKEQARLQSEHRASHDPLTGLPNRAHFMRLVDRVIEDAGRRGGRVAVMFIDLDGFKPINDTHGHAVGDEVLRILAQRMRHAVKESDVVARIAGDEFGAACALPAGDGSTARKVAGKLLSAISTPIGMGALQLGLTASIGIALFPEHGAGAQQLIEAADRCMYEVKRRGKSGVGVAPAAPV